MEQGDKVKIEGIIDACRLGLKHKEYRVQIGDKKIWIPAESIEVSDED